MTSNATPIQQLKSLEALGLTLPFSTKLVLCVTYLSALMIVILPSIDGLAVKGLALAVDALIGGIFVAFKFPLWLSKQ